MRIAYSAASCISRHHADQARAFLLDVALLPLDDSLLDQASTLGPAGIRSLDAIHLATALSIRDDIGAFFTYDDRLAESAVAYGLTVHPAMD